MMIAGLEAVTDGTILAGGTPMTEPRADIGIVFRTPPCCPGRRRCRMYFFHRDDAQEPFKLSRPCDGAPAAGAVDDAVHKRPRELSGGMRQRVSLCRALIADPGVLLMDEPFSALDAITRDDMNIVLLELWERYRKTVLFVTHSIREAVLLADRVLVMGRSPSQIIAEIKVPFARPRDFAIGETAQFNEICAGLRREIEIARGSEAATRH